jgi:RNase P subunit RPR2
MIKEWICDACKFLLGIVEGNMMRIKRKDLYVEVQGGKVTVTCCRCGKRNTVEDVAVETAQEQKGE